MLTSCCCLLPMLTLRDVCVRPPARDGLAVWHAMERYAKDFLSKFFASDEALLADAEVLAFWAHFEGQLTTGWQLPPLTGMEVLCTLLADLMFWVTAGHELVGSVVEYVSTPYGCITKLLKPGNGGDGVLPDAQTYAQGLAVIMLTGTKMPPLMSNWAHLFEAAGCKGWGVDKQQHALDASRRFQKDLATVAEEQAARNEQRAQAGQRKFVAFNPRILETAVSI